MNFIKAIDTTSADTGTQLAICTPDTCLGSVIDSLALKSVHRIYIVNGGEVVGVVTLRDVISCFIYEPPWYFEECFRSVIKDFVA